MAYEVFQRSSIRVDTPTLSLVPDGRVAINSAACRLLIEANVEKVIILWDKRHNKMAVKGATKEDANAFTITFASDLHAGTFRAKTFLDYIGWRAANRITLPVVWNASEKMFEFSLPKEHLKAGEITKKRFA